MFFIYLLPNPIVCGPCLTLAQQLPSQVIYDGRGVVYDRRWLRDSTQIINNMKISSIDMTCPNPEYATPITPFFCLWCGSNFQVYSILFMLLVHIAAIAVCFTVWTSISRMRKKRTTHWPPSHQRTDSKLVELKSDCQDVTSEW